MPYLTDADLAATVRRDFRSPVPERAYRVSILLADGGLIDYWVAARSKTAARFTAREAAVRLAGLEGFEILEAERVTL